MHTSGRGGGENDSPGVGGVGKGEEVGIAILCTERARGENLICTCARVWRTLIGGRCLGDEAAGKLAGRLRMNGTNV